eukprot:5220138-Prymnesium_polylepis.1
MTCRVWRRVVSSITMCVRVCPVRFPRVRCPVGSRPSSERRRARRARTAVRGGTPADAAGAGTGHGSWHNGTWQFGCPRPLGTGTWPQLAGPSTQK